MLASFLDDARVQKPTQRMSCPSPSTRLPFDPRLSVLLLVLAACSAGEQEEASSSHGAFVPNDGTSFQRLEVESLGELTLEMPEDREAASWSQLGEAGKTDDWQLGETSLRSIELDGQPVIAIGRKEGAQFTIPADLTFRDTPRITFNLVVRNQGYFMRVELMKDGRVKSEAKLEIVKAKNFQSLALTFPQVSGASLECDAIRLRIPRGDQPLVLESIKIEDVAAGGFLPPEAFGGWALVEIGSDARRGTCLSSAAGLRTTVQVKDLEQEISFSYALPRSVIRPGPPPKLKCQFGNTSTVMISVELPFEGDLETPSRWQEYHMNVGDWAGHELEVQFEVVSPDGQPRLAVLGQPQMIARRKYPQTVLLISSDTHRSDHLGFLAGEEGPHTEMLDRLAAEGVTFLDATSSINNTTPSHVSLFTGTTPRDTGIVANAIRLVDSAPTLADRFAELGYATIAAVSAAPVCSQFSGLGQGFDRYSNPGYRSARDSAETLEQLLAWLPDYEGVPLFVWLHVYDAHSPYETPPEFINRYYPEWLKPRDPASPVADLSLAPDWDQHIADPVYTESAYKAEVSYVDERISELLSLDRFWNATIAFTADHGETLRNGGEDRFTHRGLNHANLAVPMIFKAPHLEGGEQRRAPVQQIDVGRTLLDLAGHPDVEFPGKNVFDVAEDDITPRFAMQANGFSAAVLSGKWMLTFGLRPTRSSRDLRRDWFHQVALFDIEADEACQNDLSATEPERTAKLRSLVVRWLLEGRKNPWQSAAVGSPEEIAGKLSELGYASMENAEGSEVWMDADCDCVNCARFE